MDLDLDKLQREIEHAEQYLAAYRLNATRGFGSGDALAVEEQNTLEEIHFADSLMPRPSSPASTTASQAQNAGGSSRRSLYVDTRAESSHASDDFHDLPSNSNASSSRRSSASFSERSSSLRYQTEEDRERLISSLIAKHHRNHPDNRIVVDGPETTAEDGDGELFFAAEPQLTKKVTGGRATFSDTTSDSLQSHSRAASQSGASPQALSVEEDSMMMLAGTNRPTRPLTPRGAHRERRPNVQDGDFDGVNIGADDTLEDELSPTNGAPVVRRHNNDARIEELQKGYKKALEVRERQRAERERQELQQCTFRPELSKGTLKKLAEKKKQQQQEPHCCHDRIDPAAVAEVESTGDRLYREADERQQLRAQQAYAIAKANESAYTFQPSINPATSQIIDKDEYKPIYDRVADMQREKQAKLFQLRASVEAGNKELTFAPQIAPASAKIVRNRRAKGEQGRDQVHSDDPGARLLAEAKRMSDRRNKAIAKYEMEMQEQLAGPGLSEGSRKILAEQPELAAEFLERQQRFAQQSRQKSQHRLQQEEQKHEAWFKPAIVQNTEKILQQARPALLVENPEDRVRRLTYEYPAQKQAELQRRQQEEAAKLKFQPELNAVSKAMAPRASVEELNANRRGERLRKKAERQAKQRYKKECTFKPQLAAKSWKALAGARRDQQSDSSPLQTYPSLSINLAEPEKMSRDIALFYQEKEEKRRLAVAQRQVEELRDCTFTPAIKREPPTSSEPVVVRGLNRYLELQEAARNLKAQQKQREEEAFCVKTKPSNRSPSGTTIPQPFKLSSGRQRESRAVRELLEKEKANLTFEPETIEKSRRAITQALVEADEVMFYVPGGGDRPSLSSFDYPSYSAQFEAALARS